MKARFRHVKRYAVLTLSALLAGCASPPLRPEHAARGDYAYTRQYASWLIEREMKKHNVTGLSIALVDDQHVVWTQGFGYADEARGIPATPDTVYRAGSISKLFTASAAMQLAEQGKLDIDKPLRDYLPEFSTRTRAAHSRPITPRNIMTHHSGLPSDWFKGMWSPHPEPFTQVVDEIRGQYVATRPGIVFFYSNLGMTLLGHAVQEVSGEDFAPYMQRALLQPLGMRHSAFALQAQGPFASKAYRNGREVEDPPLRDMPAGGLNSSALDMSRFLEMVFAGGRSGEQQILKPETLAEMLRPQNADVPLDFDLRVGLGWMLSGLGGIDIRNAGPVAHHGGATLMFHGQLIALPEHKLGVVVLANSASASAVVSKVATEALKLALEAKTGIRQPPPEQPAAQPPLAAAARQAYVGYYATPLGLAKVTDRLGQLRAEVMGKTFRLEPRADGGLGLAYRVLGLFPVSLGDLDQVTLRRASVVGHDVLVARSNGRDMLVGEKIAPEPLSQDWLRRLGDYEIVNAGDDAALPDNIHLRNEDGLLVAEYSLAAQPDVKVRLALAPVSPAAAVIRGLGRGMGGTFQMVTVNGEERALFSGLELRKKSQ
jgi:CubicO group peptidase (beta-lactamase class C family)